MRRAFLILLLCSAATGQVVQVQGGSSTLLNGTGGGATVFLESSTVYAGYGCSEPGCGFGISQKFLARKAKAAVTLGDDHFSASVDGGGVGITVRGVTVEKDSKDQKLSAFVGATGLGFDTPFVETNRAQHFGAGVAYRRQIGAFTLQGLGVIAGSQRSIAASVRYTGPRFGFIGAGGVLQNDPFLNGEIDVTAIKNHLVFSANRQDLYFPDAPSVSANSAGISGNVGPFSFHGTAITGTTSQQRTEVRGETGGVAIHLGPVSIATNYYATAARRMVITSASETITRHFTATQSISGDQISFGGGYTSNRVTLSLDHEVLFFPLGGRGFQQVTDIQISFRIPHTDAVANYGTNVLPDGRTKWTAYGSNYLRGPLQGGIATPQAHYQSAGRYIIRGIVVDKSGVPVEGIAVAVGKAMVFSAENGAFFVHLRDSKALPLTVKPAESATAGTWRVVSAPLTATPGRTESETALIRIVVTREAYFRTPLEKAVADPEVPARTLCIHRYADHIPKQ